MFVSMVVLGSVYRYNLMFAMFVLSFSDFNPQHEMGVIELYQAPRVMILKQSLDTQNLPNTW